MLHCSCHADLVYAKGSCACALCMTVITEQKHNHRNQKRRRFRLPDRRRRQKNVVDSKTTTDTDLKCSSEKVKQHSNVCVFVFSAHSFCRNRLRLLEPWRTCFVVTYCLHWIVQLMSHKPFVRCVIVGNRLNDRGQAIMPMKLFEMVNCCKRHSFIHFGHCLHFWMKFKLSFVEKLI